MRADPAGMSPARRDEEVPANRVAAQISGKVCGTPNVAALQRSFVMLSFGQDRCDQLARVDPVPLTAELVPSCAISVTHIDFGMLPPASTDPVVSSSSLLVTCAAGTPWRIMLGDGLHPRGRQRHVSDGSDMMVYRVFTDVDGEGGGEGASLSGSGREGARPDSLWPALPALGSKRRNVH